MPDNQIFEMKIGLPQRTDPNLQPQIDQVTRKLYADAAPTTVKIEADIFKLGTGFFVNESGLIATDAHVVQGATKFDVSTSAGEKFSAHLVAEDDINDLALLQIDEKTPAKSKAATFGNSSVSPDAPLWGLGHADGDDHLYIAPGYYQKMDTMRDIVALQPDNDPDKLNAKLSKLTPLERQDADEFLRRQLLNGRMNVVGGDSGGPVMDKNGKVIGVIDYSDGKSNSDFTPIEKLIDLMKNKAPKFNFVSKEQPDGDWILTDISRTDGAMREPFVDNFNK